MDKDDQAEHDLKSGVVIAGKYRVEREIGRGGMGVVVAAKHIDLEQRVAIKVLQKSAAYNQDALARFMREARAAAKIRSEHVARVMDVGKLENGLTYIVMEYLDGCDLAAVLRQDGPLRISTATDYILQACEGVAAAHAAGIIHRDIKPANLYLANQPGRMNTIKILDFGVSKISKRANGNNEGSATQTGQVFGSPMYMSPEQLDSTVAIDGRTDIWALGVVLFELLAGKPPFSGKSSAGIMSAVIRDDPPKLRSFRPDVPAALEDVVIRCLEKDREHRYATVIDLAEAIAPFCGKGADETVNRIYEILAHAASEEAAGGASSSQNVESSGSSSGESSAQRSDRRSSGSHQDSAAPSLGGSSRTHGNARTKSTQRAILMGVFGIAALGIVGFTLERRTTPTPTPAGTTVSVSAAANPPTPVSSPLAPPLATSVEVKPPAPADVTITFTGAPKDTKVFQGEGEIGTTAQPLRLPRGTERITLRFVADTYAPAEIEFIPNVDQTLAITLKPSKPGATTPTTTTTKKKIPKELEPF